jgi:anthranilate 1,2-dioxygenase small subunit
MIDRELLVAVDDLQLRYITALDERDMGAWLKCFSPSPQAAHICTTREAVQAGHAVALMLDDCHARLEDRVSFITKVWAGTFQDYSTRHMVQRLGVTRQQGGEILVRTNFIVAFTPDSTGQTTILASGVYEDLVEDSGNGLHFLAKTAICDASVSPHYLVYPI